MDGEEVTAELLRVFEASLAAPGISRALLESYCARCVVLGVAGVVVRSGRVAVASAALDHGATPVQLVAAVGYPEGGADGDVKRYEAEVAIDHGAQAIELVPSYGLLKDGDQRGWLREIQDVLASVDEVPVRVVLDAAILSEAEWQEAARWLLETEVDGVVLTRGFGAGYPEVEEVISMRERLMERVALKAAGRFPGMEVAEACLKAGAMRIGSGDLERWLGGRGEG